MMDAPALTKSLHTAHSLRPDAADISLNVECHDNENQVQRASTRVDYVRIASPLFPFHASAHLIDLIGRELSARAIAGQCRSIS